MNPLSGSSQNRPQPDTSSPAATVHATLRAATHAQHVAAGRIPAMHRLFANDLTIAEYAAHLARLLGFYEPLERQAVQHANAWTRRHCLARTIALRDDLRTMGWSRRQVDAAPRCTELPSLSAAGIWGYLYVALGSMLGGRVIADRLTSVLGAVPLKFYGIGAGEGDARWIAFCSDLDRTAAADLAEISDAAGATFDSFSVWMNRPAFASSPA